MDYYEQPITDAEIDTLSTMQLIEAIARMAAAISLADARAVQYEIDRTNTLMPILDPTAYRKILPHIPGHERVVRAFVEFREEIERLKPEPIKENTMTRTNR